MATAVLSPTQTALPHQLAANSGHVPHSQLGWLRPTSIDTPIEEMRRRLDTDNYVFVKGVIPREDVLRMRSHYFSKFTKTGLLDPEVDPALGIYDPSADPAAHRGIGGGDPMGDELSILTAAHTDPDYRGFVAHPKLRQMVRALMGWDEEILLNRTMLRHNVPGGESTGVHYDKLFLRGGDAFFLTAWVPIGDTAHNGGGLIYLEDSVQLGQAIEDDFNYRARDFTEEEKINAFNANMTSIGILSDHPQAFQQDHKAIAESIDRERKGYRWLVADYEAGDIVFHHPCSIHASGKNEDSQGRIRLSTDLRFYNKKDFDAGNADRRWMKYWTSGDGL
jgi:phytanoyl-CoA hydroxylase